MKFRPQILAKLIAKHKGLSKHLLGLVADKLAAKVTEESEIETVIADLDNSLIPIADFAKLLQQEGDRRVAAVQKPAEGQEEDDEEGEQPNTPTNPSKKPKQKAPDPLAQVLQAVQALSGEVANLKKGDQQKSLNEKLTAKLTELKVPASFMKNRSYTIESEDDLDTVAGQIEADHAAYKQELVNQGLGGNSTPLGGTGGDVAKTKIEADIKGWAEKNAPQNSSPEKK